MTGRDTADTALAEALIAHAVAYDIADPDRELLTTFVIVAHWTPVVDDDRSRYTIHYPARSLPAHVVHGLLEVGRDLIDDSRED